MQGAGGSGCRVPGAGGSGCGMLGAGGTLGAACRELGALDAVPGSRGSGSHMLGAEGALGAVCRELGDLGAVCRGLGALGAACWELGALDATWQHWGALHAACWKLGALGAVISHGGTMGHICSSICLFSLAFSDVLCPSVRVEGDRFKHTNGETKEITGKREGGRWLALLCSLPGLSTTLLDSGLASPICSPKSNATA